MKKSDSKTKEDEAATKIQAGFRGHKTRQDLKKQKENQQVKDAKKSSVNTGKTAPKGGPQMSEEDKAATKIQAGFRGHKTRKELAQKKDEGDKELNQAATKIQANYRGHKTREELKKSQPPKENKTTTKYSNEEEKAATKIQAGFRGHQTRKQLNQQVCYPEESSAVVVKFVNSQSSNHLKNDTEVEDEENELRLIERRQKAVTDLQVCLKAHLKRNPRLSLASSWSLRSESPSGIDLKAFDSVDIAKFKAKQIYFGFVTFLQASFRASLVRKSVREREGLMQERKKEERSERRVNAVNVIQDLSRGAVECVKNTGTQKISEVKLLKMDKELDGVKINALTTVQINCKEIVQNLKMIDKRQQEKDRIILLSNFKMFLTRLAVKNRLIRKEMLRARSLAQEEVFNLFHSMDEKETAAAKIQAGFRGMVVRKQLNKVPDITLNQKDKQLDLKPRENTIELGRGKEIAVTTVQLCCKEYVSNMKRDTMAKRIEMGNVLQFNFKMFLTRLEVKNRLIRKEMLRARSLAQKEVSNLFHSMDKREIAATKIQAGFRGMVVRKNLKTTKALASKALYSNDTLLKNSGVESDLKLCENPPKSGDGKENLNALTVLQLCCKDYVHGMKMKNVSKSKENKYILLCNFKMFLTRLTVKNRLIRKEMLRARSMAQKEVFNVFHSMELRENAASKIQAGFRGMRSRKNYKRVSAKTLTDHTSGSQSGLEVDKDDVKLNNAATVIQARFRIYRSNKELALSETRNVDEKSSVDPVGSENKQHDAVISTVENLPDNENLTLDKAAIKIQATYRGYRTRKHHRDTVQIEVNSEAKKQRQDDGDGRSLCTTVNSVHAQDDMIPDSGDFNAENSFISATHEPKMGTKSGSTVHTRGPLAMKQHEQDLAATKIQAHYHGYKARKQFSIMKGNIKDEEKSVLGPTTESTSSSLISNAAEDVDSSQILEIKQKAASKIQAHYKGYRYRKIKTSPIQQLEQTSRNSKLLMNHNGVNLLQAAIRGALRIRNDIFDEETFSSSCSPPVNEYQQPPPSRVATSYPDRRLKKQMTVPQIIQRDENITVLQSASRGLVTRVNIVHLDKSFHGKVSTELSFKNISLVKKRDNSSESIRSETFIVNDVGEQVGTAGPEGSRELLKSTPSGGVTSENKVFKDDGMGKTEKDVQRSETRPVTAVIQTKVVVTAHSMGTRPSSSMYSLDSHKCELPYRKKCRPKSVELKRTLPLLPTPFVIRSKTEIFNKSGKKKKVISKEMLAFSFPGRMRRSLIVNDPDIESLPSSSMQPSSECSVCESPFPNSPVSSRKVREYKKQMPLFSASDPLKAKSSLNNDPSSPGRVCKQVSFVLTPNKIRSNTPDKKMNKSGKNNDERENGCEFHVSEDLVISDGNKMDISSVKAEENVDGGESNGKIERVDSDDRRDSQSSPVTLKSEISKNNNTGKSKKVERVEEMLNDDDEERRSKSMGDLKDASRKSSVIQSAGSWGCSGSKGHSHKGEGEDGRVSEPIRGISGSIIPGPIPSQDIEIPDRKQTRPELDAIDNRFEM